MAAPHEIDEREIIQRRDEMDVGLARQAGDGPARAHWIEMDRIDDLHVLARRDAGHCLANGDEAGAEILAAVAGHQNEPARRIEEGELRVQRAADRRIGIDPPQGEKQRVDGPCCRSRKSDRPAARG